MEHSSQKTPLAKTAIVFALGLVASTAVNAFLMTTTPAYAAPSKDKVTVRAQGEGGFALWNDISVEVPGVGTVVSVELTARETTTGINTVCVVLGTEEGDVAEGCTFTDQTVFEADNNLKSASLSPVTLQVFEFDEFGNVIGEAQITIQATWEGIGDTFTQRLNQHESEGKHFREHFKNSFLGRQATAEGSLNDANLGTADVADLDTVKLMIMTISESIIT
jgi:hypothetical protein